jgi:exonuclease III
MGIKSEKFVHESTTSRASKHKGYSNIKNIEHNTNLMQTLIDDNNSSDTQQNNDPRLHNLNLGAFHANKDRPRNANTRNMNNNTDLVIFHQNIKGLYYNVDELLDLWKKDFPHILCLTENHLYDHEINSTYVNGYTLGVKYCRKRRKYGGVSIFVPEGLVFSTIMLDEFCRDQDLEVCAVKLHISSLVFCILCVCRSPSGNISYFLNSLESVLNQLFMNSINLIICGNFNINYLVNTNTKLQLDSLLLSYDLYSTVDFPTRISNYSSTAIDNMFIDKFKDASFTIKPLPTGLSDHGAQILILHDIKIQNLKAYYYTKRLINGLTISEFQLNLSCESWDEIFTEEIVDSIFNSFLNTYLRIFYHSFPLKKVYHSQLNKAWVTTGIKISSQHKRGLYLLCRSTNNPKLKKKLLQNIL